MPGFYTAPMARLMSRHEFVEPQLPSLTEEPPCGQRWIHEVKHDGYRVQLIVERDKTARVFTRNGFDWTERFPSLVEVVKALSCSSAIIDGEAIVQDRRGASDFDTFQVALRRN